jgi:hypothetical protein
MVYRTIGKDKAEEYRKHCMFYMLKRSTMSIKQFDQPNKMKKKTKNKWNYLQENNSPTVDHEQAANVDSQLTQRMEETVRTLKRANHHPTKEKKRTAVN